MRIRSTVATMATAKGGPWARTASRYMMAAHGFQCVGDRIWGLFLPLYLAELSPGSVAPVAVIEVARHLAGMFLSTRVAEVCEVRGAKSVLWLLLVFENLGVLAGAGCSAAAGGEFLSRPVFWLSACCFGVDAVCSDDDLSRARLFASRCSRAISIASSSTYCRRASAASTFAASSASAAFLAATASAPRSEVRRSGNCACLFSSASRLNFSAGAGAAAGAAGFAALCSAIRVRHILM